MTNLVTEAIKPETKPSARQNADTVSTNFVGNPEGRALVEKAQKDAIKKENANLRFNPLAGLDFRAIEGFVKTDPRSSYDLDIKNPKEANIHDKVKKHLTPDSHPEAKVHVDVFKTLGGKERFAAVTVQGPGGERISSKGIGFDFEGPNPPLSQAATQQVPEFEKSLKAVLLKNGHELRNWYTINDARIETVKEQLRKTLGVTGEIGISTERVENRSLVGTDGQKRETFGTIVRVSLSDGRGIMMGNLVAKEGGNHLLVALKGFDPEKLLVKP